MPVNSHINQLKMRHQELEEKLDRALSSPSVDDMEIAEIKRQKLQLKDRIVLLKQKQHVH